MQYIRKWNHLSKQRDTILTHCRHPSINLLKLQTQTNASALIPHTLCHREINGCSSSSPGKCRPSNSKCFWKVASGLMFPASCLFCHACQSCDTSSSDICPDFVLYAEMHFFFAIVQSRLVQNIPSYIDIIQLPWWYTTILSLKLLVHHGDICSIVTITTDLDHWPYSQSSWLLFKNIL